MAIQDNFIGNLRAARDIASGTAPIVKNTKKVESPKNVPKNIDQPVATNRLKTIDDNISAHRGTLFDTAWKNPAENISPGAGIISPLTFNDVQTILPYKTLFDQAISEYANEPDQKKRITILDKYGWDTILGSLPGTASYLQVLRNTEDAVERAGDNSYQYAKTAEDLRKQLEAEINKFFPKA